MHLPATGSDATYSGRHKHLQPLLPTLAWFYGALEHSDQSLGAAANDNDRPMSVPDVDPKLDRAETLINAHEAGAIHIAKAGKWRAQYVRIDGELVPRTYWAPEGAITHIYGRRVSQEAGRPRREESAAAVDRSKASVLWFCQKLKAVPSGRPRKSFHRPKAAPPIDWSQFSHVLGHVPLAEARAACGLPPADRSLLPGLPYQPEQPAQLFPGMTAGRGARTDGSGDQSRVHREDPDTYAGDNEIVDRIATSQFAAAEPDHYAVLLSARHAGSMGDLIASNDNKGGKRLLTAAAEALEVFLAA